MPLFLTYPAPSPTPFPLQVILSQTSGFKIIVPFALQSHSTKKVTVLNAYIVCHIKKMLNYEKDCSQNINYFWKTCGFSYEEHWLPFVISLVFIIIFIIIIIILVCLQQFIYVLPSRDRNLWPLLKMLCR